MPLNRYQIRNEYSLADPELYKVADRHDPEALLEGVAMAGLVGVLRQLGDLAEFAAEIFHDLHEEVMATASRGHSLIVRVQQLEAEFPSVERTLLSQTSHTAFLYNSGVDWHANLRTDENVVTRGDLPRFVMDSYEECRGPPRLFLLDKFDVAGAGACLKRYTDPSFFKVEATSSTGKKSEGQREKKTRRVKKRGPRWRNGDTPETFPSSHAKLHQLFLEESIESGVNDPERRVKLKKRQFTGSMFDQDKGKSYMEKFLDSCSPEQKIVHEVCIDALPLPWTSENGCESGLEIVEIGTVSPLKESTQADKSSSPNTREMVVKPSIVDINDSKLNETIPTEALGGPGLNHEDDAGDMSSTVKLMNGEKHADRESTSEVGNGEGCNSDDAVSEIDNYMDALATIESEVETDSEYKKNPHYMNLKPIVVDSDASEGRRAPQGYLLDSQSIENSITSEDGTNFSEDRDSLCSISVDTLAEATPDHDEACVTITSVATANTDRENMSLDRHSMSDEVPQNITELHAGGSTVAGGVDDIFNSVQEFGEASGNSCLTDPNAMTPSVDKETIVRENSLPRPGLDEVCFNSSEPDILSGGLDQGHANQTDFWPCNEAVVDARERTPSGHWSSAEQPMRDMAGHNFSAYSESLPSTHDDLVDLLQIESKNTDSVEEHSNDLGMTDVDACSDIKPPAANPPLCDPKTPEAVKTIDVASNVDFCIPTIEGHSEDQHSASDSEQNFKILKQISEMRDPDYTPPFDLSAEALPKSQEVHSIQEVFTDVEGEEKASSASPSVGHTETLFPFSNRSETCASASSFSKYTAKAELAEAGSLDDALPGATPSGESNTEVVSRSSDGEAIDNSILGKSSPVLDLSESQDQGEKPPSEKANDTPLDHHLVEAGKQYSGSETINEGPSVSVSGDEFETTLNRVSSERDAACEDVTPNLNQLDTVETVKSWDDCETQVIISDHVQNDNHHDEYKTVSHDVVLFDIASKPASDPNSALTAEKSLNFDSSMGNVQHTDTGSISQDDAEYQHEQVIPVTSSSSLVPEFQELPVSEEPVSGSVTEECHQNGEELASMPSAELAAQKHVDVVQDVPVNLNPNMWNISSHGTPTVRLLTGSLTGNVQSSEKFVVEPLPSENTSKDIKSTSSHQIHLFEGEEDDADLHDRVLRDNQAEVKPLHVVALSSQSMNYSYQIQAPVHIEKEGTLLHANVFSSQTINYSKQIQDPAYLDREGVPLHADELSSKSVDFSTENQAPAHVDREGIINATSSYNQGQQLVPTCALQSAVCSVDSSRIPMIEPTAVFPGNNTLYGSNQTPPRVEKSREPFYTSGFPIFGTLPAEPQINLDSPPLPPLPPMQWRLSRFQNPSAASERQNVQHTHSPVQPVMRPTSNNEPDSVAQTSKPETKPEYSDGFGAQQGVPLPMTNTVPEISSVNINEMGRALESSVNINEMGRADNLSLPATSTSTTGQNDIRISEEQSCQPTNMNPHENGSLFEGHASQPEGKSDIDTSVENKGPEEIPKVTEQEAVNSDVQFLPSSTTHFEWQPPPGLMAPGDGIPWSSALDGVPTSFGGNANGTLLKKPQRPRNPLIDEVVAIDKSKLRKVERVKPPVESKPEEGESLLEQWQLRKVERVKPAMETKAEEMESLLGQLQLRKVVEKVKPPVEPKAEEREFSLEQLQLRKVGERVKMDVESKTEEQESLLEQLKLRKVGERIKPGVEQKPEETESPKIQLRKVGKRAKQEIEQKSEETESPRVHLRKVSERALPLVGSKSEDRDSLFEQIRNKSFNLKPAVLARPNIQSLQGPRTNLKVAAILEKASNIRQAMVGSDEEDDADSWSDC